MTGVVLILLVKPTVQPEDTSSRDGQALLDLLASRAASVSGMIWGRSVDKLDAIAVGLGMYDMFQQFCKPVKRTKNQYGRDCTMELLATSPGVLADDFLPFTSLRPELLRLNANATMLATNPVTDIDIIPLSETLQEAEIIAAKKDAVSFDRTSLKSSALYGYDCTMALTYQCSWAESTPKNRMVMLIGLRDVQNHVAAAKTTEFRDALDPISVKLSDDITVVHFQLQRL